MGEKGNISSGELLAVGSGAVAGVGTQVTAVIADVTDTVKDKVLDKGIDVGADAATEKWKQRRENGSGDQAPTG